MHLSLAEWHNWRASRANRTYNLNWDEDSQ
jgi:hypothetical protein